MTLHLDQARHASSDPLVDPTIQFAYTIHTGRRGRPRIEVEPSLLSTALTLRPKTRIANTAMCSARTIRRRQLEYGIAVPGPSLSQTQHIGENNNNPSSREPIDDAELDWHLAIIIQDFPTFGRRLATASLRANGVIVSESRVRDSLTRINGAPGVFGGRRVHRRRYKVAGANSLWHHDGQHGTSQSPIGLLSGTTNLPIGLIRWKIVIHAFIDGKTRLVVGIQAHNNNRAATVLTLFLNCISVHGTPSRVRGDHGTENVRVAEWMEENQGRGRGSYIWGRSVRAPGVRLWSAYWSLNTRSVHNSRIERIWYDVTEGFGGKWKDFFTDLEANEGLDVDNPAHIWLLHHLFLDEINQDALIWAEAWNNHKLQIRGEPQQTPQEMFFFSMLEDGPRGLNGPRSQSGGEGDPDPDGLEDGEDLSAFGIDWEDMDDEVLMEHHHHHNPIMPDNPFSTAPSTLSEVVCTPPNCPLPDESVHQLDHCLSQVLSVHSRSMLVRRTVWVEALHVCSQIS